MFPDFPIPECSATNNVPYHIGLSDQDASEMYRRILKTLRVKSFPNQNVLPAPTLINRWHRTTRRRYWRLSRWSELLDRFREAARAGGVVCRHEDQSDAEQHLRDLAAFKWLIRIGEVSARRLLGARRADWAMHMHADLLRAAVDLRREANWPQMRLAIDSEMHLMREIRSVFLHRKAAENVVRDAVQQAKDSFANPMSRSEFFANECRRRFLQRYPDGIVAPSGIEQENFRRAIYTCLCDQENESGPQASKFFEHVDGETKFKFSAKFAASHALPPAKQCELLLDNDIRAELHDLFIMCETMDARDTAAAATLSYLCVLAHHRQLGFYPENLASACAEFDLDPPIDSFSDGQRSLQVRLAGGEKLRGMGVENHKQKVRTKVGQPIVYSVGPDKHDDRGCIVWDGSYQGKGDWVFPLPPHKRPRHWLQFDLRKAMILMTIAGLFLAKYSSPASRYARAITAFEYAGGYVHYEGEEPEVSWSPLRWFVPEEESKVNGLTVKGPDNFREQLTLALAFKQITRLYIESGQINAGDLDLLSHYKNLEELEIEQCELDPNELSKLNHLKRLRSFSCTASSMTDEAFVALPSMPSVEQMYLSQNQFGTRSFRNFANKFPNLSELVVYETLVGDRSLVEIAKCKKLTHLDLDGTLVTDDGIAVVAGLTNLVTLDLQNTRLTDKCLAHLVNLRKLSELRLNNTKVDGSGLKHIVQLKKISILELDNTLVNDKTVGVINQFKGLLDLSLEGTRITPKATQILKSIPASVVTYPDWAAMVIIKDGKQIQYEELVAPSAPVIQDGQIQDGLAPAPVSPEQSP